MTWFEDDQNENKMTREEMLKFMEDLIKVALEGKHPQASYLSNIAELEAAKLLKKSNSKVAAGFKAAAKEAFKEYLHRLEKDLDTFDILYSYRTYKLCEDFYKKETEIYDNIISEFYAYMTISGHIIRILTGYDRPEEDKHTDYRTMEVRDRPFHG